MAEFEIFYWLSDEQREALSPVTRALEGIEQERQAVKAVREKENGFSFDLGW